MTLRTLLLCLGMALAGASLAACGDDECVAGKACACSGDCAQTCGGSNGASCSFTCPAGATCDFSCPGGGCSVTSNGAKSVTVDCPGNGCAVTCAGGGDRCAITSCQSTCQLSCGGAASCSNSCGLASACTED